jgi:hypothetical protein
VNSPGETAWSPEAISRAVRAGRLPNVGGKIDPEQAQSVWDAVKDITQVGRKLKRRGCQPALVDTPNAGLQPVDTRVDTSVDTPGATSALQPVDTSAPPVDTPVDTRAPFEIERLERIIRGRKDVAVTIAVNGAEYLELWTAATAAGMSIPAYVTTRCGYQMWRIEAARRRPAPPPRGRPVRLALERRSVTMHLTPEEYSDLDARDAVPRGPGLPLPQFVRTLLGFEVRFASLPESDERVREEDDAWQRFQRLGLNPEEYFPEG